MFKSQVRMLLKEKLKDAQKKNPSFSLRAFARNLRISPSALSEIIRGKRNLTDKAARELLDRLPLSEEEKEGMRLIWEKHEAIRTVLSPDESAELCRWPFFAILALLEIHSPPKTAEEIAVKLGLPLKATRKVLSLLEKARLVSNDGEYRNVTNPLSTTDGISSEALLRAHLEEMDLAKKAARKCDVDERDLISITFSASKSKMPEAKKEIRQFLNRLSQKMIAAEKDEVYTCAVYLYPLTNWEKSIKEEK